ncbi:hypothetical protein Tco_0412565 [Tanacetum coccineum]
MAAISTRHHEPPLQHSTVFADSKHPPPDSDATTDHHRCIMHSRRHLHPHHLHLSTVTTITPVTSPQRPQHLLTTILSSCAAVCSEVVSVGHNKLTIPVVI